MKEGTFVLGLEEGRQKEQHELRHQGSNVHQDVGNSKQSRVAEGEGSWRGSWKPAKMGPIGHSKEHRLALP